MPPPQTLSIVITTYNRSEALLAVLRGLLQQRDDRFDVVVADDGSRPEHRDAVLHSAEARALRVTHVWHPDVGFTASKVRNRGVAHAASDYIVMLDGDCIPEVDFVSQHRRLAQPGCFVNGSRVLLSAAMTQRVVSGHESPAGRGKAYWLARRFAGEANKLTHVLRWPFEAGRRQPRFSWRGIRSCNMAVWRSDYERVNGFDESFVGWGHEDADFVLRLHHAGLVRKNGFCATEVYHLWHREAQRDSESANAQRVRERQKTGIVRAAIGYDAPREPDDVVITRLG